MKGTQLAVAGGATDGGGSMKFAQLVATEPAAGDDR